LAFGLTSFFRAPLEPFSALMYAANPFATFVVCVVPRLLIGPMAYATARCVGHFNKSKMLAYGSAGLVGSLVNTVGFLGLILVFFSGLVSEALWDAVVFVLGIVVSNGLIEAGVACVLTAVLCKVLHRILGRKQA